MRGPAFRLPRGPCRQVGVQGADAVCACAESSDYPDFLESGSRGKGTDVGCSDLDVVIYVRGFEPTEAFVKAELDKGRKDFGSI